MRLRKTHLRRSMIGLALSVGLLASPSAVSAVQAIEGVVGINTVELGLPGARVVLLDLDHRVVSSVITDFEGRFRVRAPFAGEYRLLVDRPGFANRLTPAFFLDEGVETSVDLTVERTPLDLLLGPDELEWALTNAVTEQCGTRPDGTLAPAVVGVVTDRASAISLPGVSVTLEWSDRVDGLHLLQTLTSNAGIYAICDPPIEGRPSLRVEAMGIAADPVPLRFAGEGLERVDLDLSLTEEGTRGQLFGQVVDYETGLPLSTVEVQIRGADHWTLSDVNGYFRFDSIAPGMHVLEVDRVGYAHQEKVLQVVGRAAHHVDVTLSKDAIVLDPIRVEVRSRRWYADMEGLADRMASGLGYFLSHADLVARGLTRLADVGYGIPGLSVRRTGRYTTLSSRGQSCEPTVFLDGQPQRPDPVLGLDAIDAFDLYAVEYYRSRLETPAEFGSPPGCGALVAWTRRGR